MVRWFLVALILTALILTGCADRLYFFPDHRDYLFQHIPVHQDRWVEETAQVRLHAWWLPATAPVLGTVLHMHGNAANLTAHVQQVDWLTHDGYNVVVWDYRGYGESTGRATRAGLIADTMAMIRAVASWPEVQGKPLFLLGQSLGGALTVIAAGSGHMAGVQGVIVDSAFASWRGVAEEKLKTAGVFGHILAFLVPVLVSSGPDPVDKVSHIAVPLLLIQGDQDSVVPVDNLDQLYEHAHPPVVLWRVRGAGHIQSLSRFRKTVEPALLKFLRST